MSTDTRVRHGVPQLRLTLRQQVGRLLLRTRYFNWRIARDRKREPLFARLWRLLEGSLSGNAVVEAPLRLWPQGAYVYCNVMDWLVWDYFCAEGTIYEHAHIEYARGACRKGDHLLDIGANHGLWGFSLSPTLGPSGRVYLAEPNPELARRLRRSVRLNRRFDIRILPYAINDGAHSTVPFFLPKHRDSGTGSTVLHDYAVENRLLDSQRSAEVECRSVDALVHEGQVQRIDILKIDVEFGEDALIRGAVASLKRFRPRLVVCETSPTSEAFATLVDLGYLAGVLSDSEPTELKPVPRDHWGNIYFQRGL